MSNFDDIFDTQSARKNLNDQPFDKDAWAEKKQAERKAVYDLADSTAEAVSMDGGRYRDAKEHLYVYRRCPPKWRLQRPPCGQAIHRDK